MRRVEYEQFTTISGMRQSNVTLDDIDNGYVNPSPTADNPGTRYPTQPTLEVTGVYVGTLLEWDRQTNLTNFSHYEVRVSATAGAPWSSLAFDGTGLGTEGEVTVWSNTFLVHTPLPLGGDVDAPTASTWTYSVRRVTKTGVASPWSTFVSGNALAISNGDLAADSIYGNNIRAGEIVADKIAAGAIVTSKISATAISWPEDAVNYWPLDEGSGTTAADVKSGDDGTLIGAVSYTSGPGGGAVQTTGVGYLGLGAKTLFADALSSWSISFWFSSTTAAILLDNGNVYVEITTSGALRVVIRGADNNVVGPFNDGSFHNTALSWDGTNAILLVDAGSYLESTTTDLLDDLGASITDTDANAIDPQYKAWEIT